MCGIAGFAGLPLDNTEKLSRMASFIAHRGPDDAGIWEEPGVGLVHRRLSIIDLSFLAHQPMHSRCGRYVIVFNGEIYNYIELRRELEGLGESFHTNSDTEVLLVAYRRWGPACQGRLNGMWAFAVWDRFEKCLFASRDRFGKKPFYYVSTVEGLFFASEIKALLGAKVVSAEVNPAVVADFSAERILDHKEETFFRKVMKLPPGHSLLWQDHSFRISCYWDTEAEIQGMSFLSHQDIQELLNDAVSLRMRADTPVGVLLSGGLDSSSVTCLAARQAPGPLHAFATVDVPAAEEAAGIERVLSMYPNVEVHRDIMTREDFFNDLEDCLWHQEEPFADGSMVAHFRLMRRARHEGIKVVLSGQAADELFAGYPGHLALHMASLMRSGHLASFIEKGREIRATGQSAPWISALIYSLPELIVKPIRHKRSLCAIDWLQPEFQQVSERVFKGYSDCMAKGGLNAALVHSIKYRTIPGFLHYEDRNSMAHGVETRLPFLDYRLVKAVLALSPEDKTRGGFTKAFLRKAMEGIVPPEILRRSAKQGYPAPLARWLRDAGAERWGIWNDDVSVCPMINRARWLKQAKRFQRGANSALQAVWGGIILSLWYTRYIKQPV